MDSLWDIMALVVSGAALSIAVFTVWRTDRNSSAATLVSLYEAMRAAWGRYFQAEKPEQINFEFAELINLIELACAVYLDAAVHGAMREMLEEYLIEVLDLLRADGEARNRMVDLMERPNTYKYLKRFLVKMRRQEKLGKLGYQAKSGSDEITNAVEGGG